MTTAVSAVAPPPPWRDVLGELRPFLLALACGLAGFALLFRPEVAAAVRVWSDSTAYGHCFLVLPVALWLAWERRDAARGLRPRPTAWPALAAVPFGLAWFAADRLGLMEGRQLAALGMLEALLVALLGPRLARAQAPALIYLVFLVPVGSFLVPALQRFTTGFIDAGLEMLGIPHDVDAFSIEIPEGTFHVAEACAGLRFLIAAVAFGALYGFLTYRSVWRRLGFLAASIVVPIVANGLRALGIVVAGHIVGNAEAAAADHVIYGWGFFSAVIVLLALGGLAFREDPRPGRAPPPAAPRTARTGIGPAIGVAGLAALLAAAGPAAAAILDLPTPMPPLALPGFVASAECLPLGDAAAGERKFSCHGWPLVATLRVLPPHAAPAALRAAQAEATGARDAADGVAGTLQVPGAEPRTWRLLELEEPARLSASALWIDGAPAPGGIAGRLRLAWQGIAGRGAPAVLVAASLFPPPLLHGEQREAAQHTLRDFLAAQRTLLAAVAEATRP
jgi:exosortase A